MGEFVGISIGEYDFISRKNSFGDLLALFSPAELKIEECIAEDGEPYTRRYFTKNVRQAKRCLDVMGHTLSRAKRLFDYERERTIEHMLDNGEEERLNVIRQEFTFDKWKNAVKKYAIIMAKDKYENGHFRLLEKEIPSNEAEQRVHDSLPFNNDNMFFGIELFYSDQFIGDYWDVFRVILGAFNEEELLTLDYTNLYMGGWCDEFPEKNDYVASKIVILTEGSTDSNIIRDTMNLLYPDMTKYYSFIDFSAYDVQGSTSFLSHYLKAFVAAGIENRIIALFDNDSAGLAEIKNLEKHKFPDSVRIMHLPDLDFCQEYPTIGPSGKNFENINGQACSIEMYLGEDILYQEGKYIPIRWKAYLDKVDTYQGEIVSKAEVLNRFKRKLERSKQDGIKLKEWTDLNELLNMLFDAFVDV